MKFCNLLRETSVDLPQIHDLYLCYKTLKKTLKRITASLELGDTVEASEQQEAFAAELNAFIQQTNEQFMENEEQRVIDVSNLEEQALNASTPERCRQVTKLFVEFRGQMLLFIHSAMLGYISMLKILKKHGKKLGHPVDVLQRERLQSMPICQTEIASSIARRAEDSIATLMQRQREYSPMISDEGEPEVSSLMGQVNVALRTWEQLMTTASTPSTVLDTDMQWLSTLSHHCSTDSDADVESMTSSTDPTEG